jgi:Phage integrase, N-terminal SAM-like domain
MGFSRKRAGRDGKPRYTAYYLDIRGQERSAGTFPTKKAANDAWKRAEASVSAGKPGDPSRGRQTFQTYVLERWLPHHLLEPGVRKNYEGHIRNHLLLFFGSMKMRDIMPEHVREWVTYMKGKGASAQTIKFSKRRVNGSASGLWRGSSEAKATDSLTRACMPSHRSGNWYATEPGFGLEQVMAVDQISALVDGVEKSLTLSELLEAGFAASEFIRIIARGCEEQASEMFPAFMMAAGSAVEGRNVLGDAPSFPPGRGRPSVAEALGFDGDPAIVADQLAVLAERLHRRLTEAAAEDGAGDRTACQRAARAAADIHQLLARSL